MKHTCVLSASIVFLFIGTGCSDSGNDLGRAPLTTDAGAEADSGGQEADAGLEQDAGEVTEPDAGPAAPTAVALIASSDFATSAKYTVVYDDGQTGSVAAGDTDPVVARVGNRYFGLRRSGGFVEELAINTTPNAPITVGAAYDVNPAGAEGIYRSNPVSLIDLGDDEIYVVCGMRNQLVRLDVSAGTAPTDALVAEVDLSALVADGDSDTFVDASTGVRVGNRVYIGLGRYYFDETYTQNFLGSVVAVVDVATNTLVDVDASRDGVQGIELTGENPEALVYDEAGNQLLVNAHGNYFAIDGGLEVVSLETLTSTRVMLTEAALGRELNTIVFDSRARGFANVGGQVYDWQYEGGVGSVAYPGEGALSVDATSSRLIYHVSEGGGTVSGVRIYDLEAGVEVTAAGPIVIEGQFVSNVVAVGGAE